jgi:FkbM family methyltransferase
MSESSTPAGGSVNFYQALSTVLALALIGVAVAVLLMPQEAIGPSPGPAPEMLTAESSSASNPPPAPPAVWVEVNLARKISQLPVLASDSVMYDELLDPSPPAAVRSRILGFGTREAFGFDRRQTVTTMVVAGTGILEHTCTPDGMVQEVTLPAGSLVTIPPYCGHAWRNVGTEQMTALLQFESPAPLDSSISTRVLITTDDPRGSVGPDIEVHHLSTVPASYLGQRLQVVDLENGAALAASSAIQTVFVLSGQGFIVNSDDMPHTAMPGWLVMIPAGSPATVRVTEGPLRVLLFDPADDGVEEVVRSGRSEFSQGAEERVARAVFEDARELVFLDVGSAHPQEISTTYYLENRLGWSGIAIDAQPEYGPQYATLRPNTTFVSYFVSDQDDEAETLYRDSRVPVVASNSRQVAEEQTQQAMGNLNIEELDVTTISLNTLLTRQGVEHVDFVSMDIEEHEPEALNGFDIEKYAPGLVCIEAHGRTQDELYTYFAEHGYERLDQYLPYDTVNWYFAPAASDAD